MEKCRGCKECKPADQFYIRTIHGVSKVDYYCKVCRLAAHKRYRVGRNIKLKAFKAKMIAEGMIHE